MARLELTPEVLDDFDRIAEHLRRFEAEGIGQRIAGLVEAMQLLTHSPLVGRKTGKHLLRELVIGRGTHGYVALYRFVPDLDTVVVLAVRAQREADYRLAG
jgi:toxin ParE1/3/4